MRKSTPSLAIGVLVESGSTFAQDVLRGAMLYGQMHPSVEVGPSNNPRLLAHSGKACIVQSNQHQDQTFAGVPPHRGINISHASPTSHFPRLTNDDSAVGRMAADHFLSRGHSRFLFVGKKALTYSETRRQAFQQQLSTRLPDKAVHVHAVDTNDFTRTGPDPLQKLLHPLPLAVFCSNDGVAAQVIRHVTEAGFQVPQQVAVLGVDDDEMQNLHSPVAISSIRLNGQRLGYNAAHLLHQLHQQPAPLPEPAFLPPNGLVLRASTEVIAHDDPLIRKVLAYIDQHYASAIQVQDLVQLTGLSRRSLEVKFKAACGDTLLQRIHAVRMEHARNLLAFTNLPVETVAQKSGFGEARQLISAFKRQLNTTPGTYRKDHSPSIS